MRIGHLEIENFRGFDSRSFDFDSKMNVVLGNNTTGKTTLLHAVQVALGSYLQELTIVSGSSRNFKSSDRKRKYSQANSSWMPAPEKPSVMVDATVVYGQYFLDSKEYDCSERDIRWRRTSNRNSHENAGDLMDAVRWMDDFRRNADETKITSILPLMLSFGAARLENNYNGKEKTSARASREEKAYKCALDEKVDFKSAFNWIYKFDKELAKGREFEGTDTAFIEAIKTAVPTIEEIDIDTKNSEFNAKIQMETDEKSKWLEYNMMSDGFKSMINIAAEIAYRSILLNGFMGANAVKETPGIVMIDEVDLYLHPHWQQNVLADLQDAFPKIQFIVTTHSPFIVQSVAARNIIKLDGEIGDTDPNKRSIEEVAITEMNLNTVRSSNYNKMLEVAEKYYQLVLNNDIKADDVKKELDALELEFSDDPAYVALLRAERNSK